MTRIGAIVLLAIFAAQPSGAFASANNDAVVLPIGMYSVDLVPRPLNFSTGECPDVRQVPLRNNQILAELLLLCKALQLGGITSRFDFKNTTDYLRIINGAAEAKSLMPGFLVWRKDVNEDLFYISDAVLQKRELVKGVYTVVNNKKLLGIKHSDELKQYVVATNQNWAHDNTELTCMESKMTTAASNPFSMARMVSAGRADFLLFPFFSSPDLAGSLADIPLVVVPGVKVAFSDSLHFIVSKKHSSGLAVYQAMQKGLETLHKDGTVRYTYEQLGFFNPLVKDWIELGCKNVDRPVSATTLIKNNLPW